MADASRSQRRFEPLEKHHARAAFSCGSYPYLDVFLKTQALQEMKRLMSGTRVLVDLSAPDTILGYYTLSSTSILFDRVPIALSMRIPKYPQVPATLLGRLAVDQRFQGHGLGKHLLIDGLLQSYRAGLTIGSAVVIVDAIDASASAFYTKYGFVPFADKPQQLFLMMKSVRAMLREAELGF